MLTQSDLLMTPEMLADYSRNGFVLLDRMLSRMEVSEIKAHVSSFATAEELRGHAKSCTVMESDGRTVRSVYGCHLEDPWFSDMTRDARWLVPAQQILNSSLYVHQFKVNVKSAFTGDLWQWHRDYVFWQEEDGIAAPSLTTVALFLDEVNEFNGPVVFIPGSHRDSAPEVSIQDTNPTGGEASPDWIAHLSANLKYSIPRTEIIRLVQRSGLQAPKGGAGSILIFHPNVAHASGPNLSPFQRSIILITYNSIDNRPMQRASMRPSFLCGRDYAALAAR